MACPSTALINLNEDGNDGGEKIEEKENKPVELLCANSQLLRSSEMMEEEDDGGKTPLRYVPLCDVYSATSPCVSSASGGSKKVKPPHVHPHHRKLQSHFSGCDSSAKDDQFLSAPAGGTVAGVVDGNVRVSGGSCAGEEKGKPPITKFYARRDKGKGKVKEVKVEKELKGQLGFDGRENLRSRGVNLGSGKGKEVEKLGNEEEGGELVGKKGKRRKLGGCELANLGVDSTAFSNLDSLQFRGPRKSNFVYSDISNKNFSVSDTNLDENCGKMKKRKQNGDLENDVENLGSVRKKRWMWYLFGFFRFLFH